MTLHSIRSFDTCYKIWKIDVMSCLQSSALTPPAIITRASLGVLKPSKGQKELESQERFEQKEKAQRYAEREGAKRRKHEKLMKPRVENVSQLL